MKIEQFVGEIPIERLKQHVAGQTVILEVLSMDVQTGKQNANQDRFYERFPNLREATEQEIRDYNAANFTALLEVWNRGESGLPSNPAAGIEDVLTPAVRILSARLEITRVRQREVPCDGETLSLIEIENRQGLQLVFPARHPLGPDAPIMTIVQNPASGRTEVTIRLYNTALVLIQE